MASYRFVFADLLSDADIAELDLSNVSMDRRIIQPGSFSADIPVPNRDVGAQVRKILPDPITRVPQSICHVYQDGLIWGSYVVWTWKASVSERGFTTVSIQGATLESWLNRRMLDADKTFVQVDQIEIARQLLLEAQNAWLPYADSANLGITALSGTSGKLRDRTYLKSEATSVGKRLEELANVSDGFEWMINTWLDESIGSRRREFVWGYPGLGQLESAHTFELPGNITNLVVTHDVTEAGTAFWARGDTPESDVTAAAEPLMTAQPLVVDSLLSAGWPWLDYVSDHQGVTVLSTLQDYATWYAQTRAGTVRTIEVSVRLPDVGAFHPSRLGDYALLNAVTEFWPLDDTHAPTFSAIVRVVGIELQPATRGEGVDIAKLVLSDENTNPSISLVEVPTDDSGETPDPEPEPGVLSAGADATISPSFTFTRTATEPEGVSSREWKIVTGPMGEGTVIGNAAALSWQPGSSVNKDTTTDLRQPVCLEMALELVSTAENSSTVWQDHYDYIEDIGDMRGLTGGLIGFTSATDDMRLLVVHYGTLRPTGNPLTPFLSGLEECSEIGYGPDASDAAEEYLGSAFISAWESAAASDPLFRQAQRTLRKSMYIDDALTQALADGVGPLGFALHYDILVNHGVGSDSESYGGIIAAARASSSKPPSAGGSESAYLTKLCDLRDAVLVSWGDFQSDGRSTIYRALNTAGKRTLLAPFSWSVYGESFSITTRPNPPSDGVLGNYVLRYTTNTGSDDVTVHVQ